MNKGPSPARKQMRSHDGFQCRTRERIARLKAKQALSEEIKRPLISERRRVEVERARRT